MKFGDKLIILRKGKGLSQEDLAEKLGVSRQSVSKWESNTTYPETDKIVQICNLFDCSMDDLINDKITDVEQSLRKNKTNINYMFDSLLEFITKSINMFSSMKFTTGFKCIFEMCFLVFILVICGFILSNLVGSTFSGLFKVFGGNVYRIVDSITTGITSIICLIIGFIITIHTFKIRFLDYYDKAVEEKKNQDIQTEKTDESSEEDRDGNDRNFDLNDDKDKIVIRDENDKPFAFLGAFSKIIIMFIKFIAACIGFCVACTFIALVIACFVTLSFIGVHTMFFGATLGLAACCVICAQIIMLIINFIFNKKTNVLVLIIVCLSSLCFLGIGAGISTVSLKNLKIIDERDPKMYEMSKVNFEYQDNLVVNTTHHGQELHLIADDSLEGNKMIAEMETAKDLCNIEISGVYMNDNMPVIRFYDNFNGNIPEAIRFFSNDLKKNQLHIDYSGSDRVINIYANSETLNKLIENTKKLYLFELTEEDGYRKLDIKDDKVYIHSEVDVEYNALEDRIENDYDNICKREFEDTQYGQKMIIKCFYPESQTRIEE